MQSLVPQKKRIEEYGTGDEEDVAHGRALHTHKQSIIKNVYVCVALCCRQ